MPSSAVAMFPLSTTSTTSGEVTFPPGHHWLRRSPAARLRRRVHVDDSYRECWRCRLRQGGGLNHHYLDFRVMPIHLGEAGGGPGTVAVEVRIIRPLSRMRRACPGLLDLDEGVAQTIAVVGGAQPAEAPRANFGDSADIYVAPSAPRLRVVRRYLVIDHNQFPVAQLYATPSDHCGSDGTRATTALSRVDRSGNGPPPTAAAGARRSDSHRLTPQAR